MKRIFCIFLVLLLCIGIFGCREEIPNTSDTPDTSLPAESSSPEENSSLPVEDTSLPEESDPAYSERIVYEEDNVLATDKNVIKAWSGDYSEEKRKDVINNYVKNCTPVTFQNIGDNKSVSFEVDFDVVSGYTAIISAVDNSDINKELNGYTDNIIRAQTDGKKVTLDVSIWYNDSLKQRYRVWSYLVNLEDTDGNIHFYYFRVDYWAQSFEELYPLSTDDAAYIEAENDSFYVGGIVVNRYRNALVLAPDGSELKEKWGEKVCVITDNAEDFCMGDIVDVYFTKAYRPYNTTQYVRITADQILLREDILVDKPIIYLYPQTPTLCSVSIGIDGYLTCTYPEYGADGWRDFTAYPDGTLVFPDGREYYALYWEGVQNTVWDFTKGFCVRGEDTAAFLERALAAQGLTPREANEFIVYWLPLMQDNPYNVISFQTDAYTDTAVLNISPAPDSVLRVFMAYYPSDTSVDIEPQSFTPFTRRGFTAVEWGGSRVSRP